MSKHTQHSSTAYWLLSLVAITMGLLFFISRPVNVSADTVNNSATGYALPTMWNLNSATITPDQATATNPYTITLPAETEVAPAGSAINSFIAFVQGNGTLQAVNAPALTYKTETATGATAIGSVLDEVPTGTTLHYRYTTATDETSDYYFKIDNNNLPLADPTFTYQLQGDSTNYPFSTTTASQSAPLQIGVNTTSFMLSALYHSLNPNVGSGGVIDPSGTWKPVGNAPAIKDNNGLVQGLAPNQTYHYQYISNPDVTFAPQKTYDFYFSTTDPGTTPTPGDSGNSSSTGTGTGTGVVTPPTTGSSSTTSTTSSSSATGSTTKPSTGNSTATSSVVKGTAVYATKTIYLYKNPTFKASQRIVKYSKQTRPNRPMFVVTGTAKSKNGVLRYKVKDVNHKSATDGKTGYITANKNYVLPVYYATKHSTVKVIAKTGLNSYKTVKQTGKVKHYKKGATLKVAKIVKHNLTTRFVLTNGHYITANKKFVIAE